MIRWILGFTNPKDGKTVRRVQSFKKQDQARERRDTLAKRYRYRAYSVLPEEGDDGK